MPRYMLDTDTCSYIMKRSNDAVLKRLSKVPVHDVCISVITKSELLYGVEVSRGAATTKPPSPNSCVTPRSWTSPAKPLRTTPKSALI